MKKEFPRWLTGLLLLAAAGLCVWGAAGGQARDLLTKAATICMECIGLG